MKKKILSMVLTLCMVMSLIPAYTIHAEAAAEEYNGQKGTGDYTISSSTALKELATQVNAGTNYSGSTFKLTKDIDLNPLFFSLSWTPIGGTKTFDGTFDGGGYTVSGLLINATDKSCQALFGGIGSTGKVMNLSVEGNVTVSNSGTVSCNNIGGIAGYNDGSITNCSFNGTITYNGVNGNNIGGVVGYNSGMVTNCYNEGTLTSGKGPISDYYPSGNAFGGVVGKNGGTVANCYNTGTLNCYNVNSTGGVVGRNGKADGSTGAKTANCYNAGLVGGGTSVGGVVGQSDGSVTNCYNNRDVSILTMGSTAEGQRGAVVGNIYSGTVSDCYYLSGTAACGIGGTSSDTSGVTNAYSVSGTTCTLSPSTTVTVDSNSYGSTTDLLTALNDWVYLTASTDYCTWDTGVKSSKPVVFSSAFVSYAPTISPMPVGANYSIGDTAKAMLVSASLAGSTLSYQWYSNKSNSTSGEPISGANSSSYTPSTASPGATYYYCIVSNSTSARYGTATSSIATITIANPTYAATVTVKKDDSSWATGAPAITIGTNSGTATVNGSSLVNGTYNIYAGGIDTNANITVSSSPATAVLNYYTLTATASTGVASVTGNNVYLAGASVAMNAVVTSGYTWEKWTSSNNTTLADSTMQAYSFTMPSSAITLTATTTLDTYTISCTLNGGTLASANPVSYTVKSAAITLNNPTRDGFSFVGWTGSNGETAQTSVTIATNSTGGRSYTANWKANTPATPTASIITGKTDISLTIATQAGYEYSMDGTNWHSGAGSYTFTGLTAGTAYNLVCRKAAVSTGDVSSASDASLALAISTKFASPAAPSLAFGSITANSITVIAVTGAEYSNDNGVNWQEDNSFSKLATATQYTFAIRKKETANTVAGIKASIVQYTAAATPTAGEGYNFSYSTEEITITSGYEVSTDANFGTTIANNTALTPGTTYYVRVAASGGVPASNYVQFALPTRPTTPNAIYASKTSGSIAVSTTAGQEYKINDGTWQDGGSFTGLSANTDYTVYTRVKATEKTFASLEYSVSITTKSLGSITVPTPDAVIYSPHVTLADITLPDGWVWSLRETIPTVAISGYSAVYTPTDTDVVDYSGVSGYVVDGSGTVTITKTISLTVNRATPTASDFTYTAPTALNYSDTAKTASVTAKDGVSGMGIVTVRYYLGAVETTPTNVGTYTVKIDVAQGANYAAATAITDDAWTFTIAAVAQAPLSITNKPASVTYGDSFTLNTTGGSGTGNVTWDITNGDSPEVNASTGVVTITGIGETTITATKAADGNYTAAVTDTYTFTPTKLQLTVASPTATEGWTKTYDGDTAFDTAGITVGSITNKVGTDDVTVLAQSATFATADVGSDKNLTITYSIGGDDSGHYTVPENTVITTASITAAIPTIALVRKTSTYTGSIIEIAPATVSGIDTEDDITNNYASAVTYNYYTKDTCTDADKTTVDKSGAEAIGGAPKNGGTYYVKATISANGNYAEADSTVVTLTIYYPSTGSSAPVIVDGKTVDMGTSEVKNGTTTVTVDQNKLMEQLKNAYNSVVIPIRSKTDTASAQLVVQNVERMAEQGVSLTIIAGDVSYSIPAGAIDTAFAMEALGASDSSKVPLNITISQLSNSSVTIQNGTLMVPPVEFTVTATYNGKSVEVERFGQYVQRVIEIPDGTDPESITTAVVLEADGTERHVPTEVYSENGKWYARINSMTNSTYALIQNNASFTDIAGKWYDATVIELASRKVISGIGEKMFAGERAITRAEFAAIVVRALGLPTDDEAAFSDVASSDWYYGAVGTAFEYGIVCGKGEGQFDPAGNITRQEAMAIISRAAKLAGYAGKVDNISGFSDVDEIAAWALDAVKFNVGSGLIVGSNGQLRPQDEISRAETATVVLRLLRNSNLIDVRNSITP